MMWAWTAMLLVWRVAWVSGQGYCLATDNSPYLFFATKTAYEFVYEKSLNHRPIPGCHAVHMWMVSRHGTSYPNRQRMAALAHLSSFRDIIVNNHRNRRNGELCDEDLDALKDWRWNLDEERADTLTEQGRRDMVFLAKRLKTNFPSVLNSPTPDSFTFKMSGAETARASAKEFAEELLGHVSPVYLTEANMDSHLSTENCSSLRSDEATSKLAFEVEKFRQSPLAVGLIKSVSSRLGFLYNLTLEAVLEVYDACSYEKAWDYSKTSPWCAAFTKRDLKVLEYLEDLKQFYTNGYGSSLALKFGCPLVRDLMQTFKQAADNEEPQVPSGVFYWGDETLLEAVMSRLGIADDKRQLPASLSSLTSQEKRQWRTAFISPYAGNVAAVLYKCTSGEPNQVMFYINEHIVEYEGCQVGLCSWQYLKQRFDAVISKSCGYEFCDSLTDSGVLHHPATLTSVLVIVLLQVFLYL